MAERTVPTNEEQRPHPDRRALAVAWFGILGPPAAWAAQLLLSDAFAEVGCEAGGFSAISLVLVVITLAALAVAGSAGVVAFLRMRQTRRRRDEPPPFERMSFMGPFPRLSTPLFL